MFTDSNEIIPQVTDEDMLQLKPLPEDAPEWANILNENVGEIMSVMNRTMGLIDGLSKEVGPLVDSLTKSPILKMFGGK